MENRVITGKVTGSPQQEILSNKASEPFTEVVRVSSSGKTAIYSQPISTISASSLQFAVSSNTNEWYTPERYVEAVREVLGGRIALDPATSKEANEVVGAERHHTIFDDGLAQSWNAATLFLNPPYGLINGKSQSGVWAQRLISEYNAGNVREAILLVNSSTSEGWFQPLFQYPICFTSHRIRFNGQDGKGKAPTKGNAFVYFGNNPDRFASVFEARNIGTVLIRYRQECAAGEEAAESA